MFPSKTLMIMTNYFNNHINLDGNNPRIDIDETSIRHLCVESMSIQRWSEGLCYLGNNFLIWDKIDYDRSPLTNHISVKYQHFLQILWYVINDAHSIYVAGVKQLSEANQEISIQSKKLSSQYLCMLIKWWVFLDGLVHDCSISIANTLVILQPGTKPSIYCVKQSHLLISLW